MDKKVALNLLLALLSADTMASEKEANDFCSSVKLRDSSQESCIKFIVSNEVEKAVLDLCGGGFKDSDHQLKCVHSGAERDDIKHCLTLRWSEENILSCLVYGSNFERVDACLVFSRNEDNQVKCLKTGRHPSQVLACASFSTDDAQKLDCLGVDTPAYAVKECKRTNKSEIDRLKCLQKFVDPNLK